MSRLINSLTTSGSPAPDDTRHPLPSYPGEFGPTGPNRRPLTSKESSSIDEKQLHSGTLVVERKIRKPLPHASIEAGEMVECTRPNCTLTAQGGFDQCVSCREQLLLWRIERERECIAAGVCIVSRKCGRPPAPGSAKCLEHQASNSAAAASLREQRIATDACVSCGGEKEKGCTTRSCGVCKERDKMTRQETKMRKKRDSEASGTANN